jgi:hypothetical protein
MELAYILIILLGVNILDARFIPVLLNIYVLCKVKTDLSIIIAFFPKMIRNGCCCRTWTNLLCCSFQKNALIRYCDNFRCCSPRERFCRFLSYGFLKEPCMLASNCSLSWWMNSYYKWILTCSFCYKSMKNAECYKLSRSFYSVLPLVAVYMFL